MKHRRGLILLAIVTSGMATILSTISLLCSQWIVAKAHFVNEGSSEQDSRIKYGLFSGIFDMTLTGMQTSYQIKMTCLIDKNICALICKNTAKEREEVLNKLYHNEYVPFDYSCPQVYRTFKTYPLDFNHFSVDVNEFRSNLINAGCYVTTTLATFLSAIFGSLAVILTMWHMAATPTAKISSMYAICIYNGLAMLFILVAVCVWGGYYTARLLKNLGFHMTVTEVMSASGTTFLGYGYWINTVAVFLYFASVGILFSRQRVVERLEEDDRAMAQIQQDLMLSLSRHAVS